MPHALAQSETNAAPASAEAGLVARLDAPLPREIEVGGGTALFVCGTCFHRAEPISQLVLVLDELEQPFAAFGMPRLDQLESHRHPHAYLSGFWGTVRIAPRPHGPFELKLRARLKGGGEATTTLATVDVALPPTAPLRLDYKPLPGPLVAICMATYNPPIDLFRRQVDSIRAQSHENWVCIVSDDRSSPARFAAIERELADDRRFVVSQAPRRLGFYRNFERALALAPAQAEFVALSDQDDRWYPDKLSVLLDAMTGAHLAYSDVRVIDEDERIISETYWTTRRNNHSDLLSLLIANCVTGAASVFRRDVLDRALPFPPQQFGHFHDHWIATVALALGRVEFVERPLYDYVQHRDAVLGHEAANRMVAFRERLGYLRKDARERVRLWRFHYFVDVSRLTQIATILELRCGARMPAAKRRALGRFLRAERSPIALLNLWRRGLRELIGTPETLGGEWMLAYAFTWRRLLTASARQRPRRRLRLDALPPPDLWVKPGQAEPHDGSIPPVTKRVAPLILEPGPRAPARVNVLIGTIDLAAVSGELIAALSLARRLSERSLRVRVVTVDPVRPLQGGWERQIESWPGLTGVFDQVELALAREARDLEVSPSDAFIAANPWSAHVAERAVRELDAGPFLYLIDDYEPLLAPTGSHAALAEQSYRFAHHAVFAGDPLRDYFRRHELGVFGAAPGGGSSLVFQPPIRQACVPAAGELRSRRPRRLLLIGHPDRSGRDNVFDLGVAALQEALGEGALTGWELRCAGGIAGAPALALGGAAKLRPGASADRLADYDLGLALGLTPALPLAAIELAAAGAVAVTNSYETKTAATLAGISPDLLVAPATVEGLTDALRDAAIRVEDADTRAHGGELVWSRSWLQTFDDELIDGVTALLER